MTKEAILTEIRAAAKECGGRIGLRAFAKRTGLPESQILGKYWATWNDALREAGIRTMRFEKKRTPDEIVLEALAQLTSRLGNWPSERQLSLERRRDRTFPSLQTVRRLRRAEDIKAKLLAHCATRDDLALARDVFLRLPEPKVSDKSGIDRAPIKGFVYMMRSGRRYKIGHTSSPTRRHREVRLDLPDPTYLVHTIETDDPSGIEAYWHRRFAAKRVRNTEFFKLDAKDVAAFKRRRYQ